VVQKSPFVADEIGTFCLTLYITRLWRAFAHGNVGRKIVHMSKANQKFVQADEAVSPVIGVILMVAITVVLAAVVFVLVSNLSKGANDAAPKIGFTKSGVGNSTVLTVISAEPVLWSALSASTTDTALCTVQAPTSGNVTAGQQIKFTGASGAGCPGQTFNLIHLGSNSVVYTVAL
jgi:archaeal type IV pilus assembly protein PilA